MVGHQLLVEVLAPADNPPINSVYAPAGCRPMPRQRLGLDIRDRAPLPPAPRGLDVEKGHRRLLPRIARPARGRPSPGARTGGTRPRTPQGTAGLTETLVWTPVRRGLRGGRRSLPRAFLSGIRQFRRKLVKTRGNSRKHQWNQGPAGGRGAETRGKPPFRQGRYPSVGPMRPGTGTGRYPPANRQRSPNPRPITVSGPAPPRVLRDAVTRQLKTRLPVVPQGTIILACPPQDRRRTGQGSGRRRCTDRASRRHSAGNKSRQLAGL